LQIELKNRNLGAQRSEKSLHFRPKRADARSGKNRNFPNPFAVVCPGRERRKKKMKIELQSIGLPYRISVDIEEKESALFTVTHLG
jgi:hypothetical protein